MPPDHPKSPHHPDSKIENHNSAHPVFHYELLRTDAGSAARRGMFQTPHGSVQTPAFMPVGTQGTVKGVTVDQLRATGAQMILGNTYHLALRPGEDVITDLGGLHTFFGWDGPILTDSGGFQVYSLADRAQTEETGVRFCSHIDGTAMELTPERAIAIQAALGSDIAMQLDHVVALPAERAVVADAMRRSLRWAERCQQAQTRSDQALFAIVQGGLDPELRRESAQELVKLDFPGYAIGGLSVGEPPAAMVRALDFTVPQLPANHPRYLMGVGRPLDLLEAIARGIDLFDCVIPTRNGRNALAFTDEGPLRLRNQCYTRDEAPLEADCPCCACRHSRGYLRHLFQAGEMLGPILLSIHNLTYYQRLMSAARDAIEQDVFAAFHAARLSGWNRGARSELASGGCEPSDA